MLLSAPLPVVPPATPERHRLVAWLPAGRERILWAAGGALALLIAVTIGVAALDDGDATKDTPAPGSTDTSPNVSPSTAPTVTVDPAQYRGKPVADVQAALKALGLPSTVHQIPNDGTHTAGTVADLRPAGTVPVGKNVTLDVWGAPPKAEPKDNSGPGNGKKKKGHGKH